MSSRRRTRSATNDADVPAAASGAGGGGGNGGAALEAMRERSRAVAEREASRLARPERRAARGGLGHSKVAVKSTTPFGGSVRSPGGNASAEVEEWCGPFSVARQMIAAREEARRLREEQLAEEGDDAENGMASHPLDEATALALERKRRSENPSVNWVSRRKRDGANGGDGRSASYYAKRRRRFNMQKDLLLGSGGSNRVPTLFQLCVNYLVENFDHIETLGLVDHSIRTALCETLVATGRMNGAAFDVLAETGVETLELIDCAKVTQDQFCDALKALLPSGLRAILLKHCGRCFSRQAVEVVADVAARDQLELFAISLGGAYLLKDEDAAKLIGAAKRTLSSIDLVACPLIGTQFCQAIGEHFASPVEGGESNNGCLLELSLQNVPLSKDALLSLGASSDALRNLKSLALREIDDVDDEAVSIILAAVDGGSLKGVDLSGNPQLTDATLSSIRRCNVNGNLRALQLSGLKNLTAIGLEAFFTPIDGLPSPPMLRKLDLSQCSFDEVADAAVVLAAKASSFRHSSTYAAHDDDLHPNPESLVSEVSSATKKGLVHLSIAGSSVSDKTMENLAATCSSSLQELDVSFCVNVSDKGLGYLVSKVERQFTKLNIWGMAQITDDFLDGHDRLDEGGLEIVGAWMKKSGGRSLR